MDTAAVFNLTFALVSIASTCVSVLLYMASRSLYKPDIRVTRADTGESITLAKPSAEQSKNERSAQVHKLLDLVDAH